MASPPPRRAIEHSFAALRELAIGLGSLGERLQNAGDALLGLESPDVPEAAREEFKTLIADIMGVESPDELPDADATALALRIVVFHERILLSS